jgi:alcohol dehydrogenase YqhD (iron-dependent ADH family)
MDSFVFHSPVKVLLGKDSIEKIGSEIKAAGIKKVLILLGAGSVKTNGVYTRVKKTLTDSGIEDVEVWGV